MPCPALALRRAQALPITGGQRRWRAAWFAAGMLSRAMRVRALALLLPALLLVGPMAHAHGDGDQDRARAALQAGKVLPLRTVLDRLAREQPGQVLEVELDEEDGRWIYEIKLLQGDGRRLRLEIDAATGELLRSRERSGRSRGRH